MKSIILRFSNLSDIGFYTLRLVVVKVQPDKRMAIAMKIGQNVNLKWLKILQYCNVDRSV